MGSRGKHILTSAKKGVDSAVFLTIKSIQDGVWQGGRNTTFGLKEKGVGLGKVSSEVPQADIDAVVEIGKRDRVRPDHRDPDGGREALAVDIAARSWDAVRLASPATVRRIC